MNEKEISTKEKIKNATLKLMESEDIDCLSIRKIAEEAEVNTAAINYHYKTKDNLIYEAVLSGNQEGLKQIITVLEDKNILPQKRLYSYLEFQMQVLIKYPRPSLIAIKSNILDNKKREHISPDNITANYYNALFNVIAEISGKNDKEFIKYLVIMLNSAIVFPFLSQNYWKKYCSFTLTNKVENQSYIDFLYKIILLQLEDIRNEK